MNGSWLFHSRVALVVAMIRGRYVRCGAVVVAGRVRIGYMCSTAIEQRLGDAPRGVRVTHKALCLEHRTSRYVDSEAGLKDEKSRAAWESLSSGNRSAELGSTVAGPFQSAEAGT
jgi:hypothetical protein